MFDCELVGKIGSMALIRRDDYDIDYNVFSRLGAELEPGFIWISSGAVEIGRIDYMRRNGGKEILDSAQGEVNACYAAQGQSILMENYRKFVNPSYSVRQVLVEHQHFNEPEKSKFIKKLLLDCVKQNAIPIVNYNDSVSNEETRKMELFSLRKQQEKVVECIDNDETASEIASLVKAKYLLILTSSIGLLEDPQDETSLVKEVIGKNVYELIDNINELKRCCSGASRQGANGMRAKLEYISEPIKNGTTVIIGHAKYKIKDLLLGNVERTIFRVG
ncbi:uridylate kinase [Mobilitalea sibirica]|uniref:Uridylate kinase n=1 Tax=Mobilitalea sibirica TaxID=1462919 RepID=A0A8J7KZT1_9FIRM|nr:uridylate kinase [Mobilitalea sibirica]MBH1940908.1 uridylate kinase [Mobilitalea sibirica]